MPKLLLLEMQEVKTLICHPHLLHCLPPVNTSCYLLNLAIQIFLGNYLTVQKKKSISSNKMPWDFACMKGEGQRMGLFVYSKVIFSINTARNVHFRWFWNKKMSKLDTSQTRHVFDRSGNQFITRTANADWQAYFLHSSVIDFHYFSIIMLTRCTRRMLIGGWQGRIQKFLQYRGRKHFLRRKAAVPVPHTQSGAMPLQK